MIKAYFQECINVADSRYVVWDEGSQFVVQIYGLWCIPEKVRVTKDKKIIYNYIIFPQCSGFYKCQNEMKKKKFQLLKSSC